MSGEEQIKTGNYLLGSSDIIMEGHVRRVLMHEKVAEASYLPRYCYFAVSRWFAASLAAEEAGRWSAALVVGDQRQARGPEPD